MQLPSPPPPPPACAAGSINFIATAQSEFLDYADLFIDTQTSASVVTNAFTFTNNHDSFINSDPTLTVIAGTFDYSSTALTSSSLKLLTSPAPPAPVPGPLPVFGACAAFGYSRKLRRRVKSIC